jgi:hypothetical protein
MPTPRYAYTRPDWIADGDHLAVQVNTTANELRLLESNGYTDAVIDVYRRLEVARQNLADYQLAAVATVLDRMTHEDPPVPEVAHWSNEIGRLTAEFDATLEREQARCGALYARVFGNRAYILDGVRLDFTDGPAALATLKDDDIPGDLLAWLGMVVAEAPRAETERITKNFGATWTTGMPPANSSM